MVLETVRDILVAAVLAGATRVLDVRRTGTIGAVYKDATELVTEADRASDEAILSVFAAGFGGLDPSIAFHLEESGVTGTTGLRWAGADPLDGTGHFAAGGTFYVVQAHFIDNGVPVAGVIFQPEAFLPFSETDACLGRIVYATRGGGVFVRRTTFTGNGFDLGELRRVSAPRPARRQTIVACVPFSGKMSERERALALKVHASGLLGSTTGTGSAGGNALMVLFGGHEAYANFGAGEDLDLAPAQVIAEEAGLTVWGPDRRPPVWHVRKQPFIIALDEDVANRILSAAGL